MSGEPRIRAPSETLTLAVRAAARAGVTRVSDVTAFAVPGIPVFQATRPGSRSLSVSQGKGLTATAAIVGALLEAVELWSAESLAQSAAKRPLSALAPGEVAAWSGPRDRLAIDLDRDAPRGWLPGTDLLSGTAQLVPWDLLSLDCTREAPGFPASSVGLACGNDRSEALVSGLAEALEHHALALFERLPPRDKLARQVRLATIADPLIERLLRRIGAAGFRAKAWSLMGETGYPAVLCTLLRSEACLDGLAPAAGSGCHPSARIALLRALLEAVQTRAGLVAGARDDVTAEDYGSGREREAAIVFGSLAFGDGLLDWRRVPTTECRSSAECLDVLLAAAAAQSSLPVIAFDHEPPAAGLHLAHVLAPGLLDRERSALPGAVPATPRAAPPSSLRNRSGKGNAPPAPRRLLFAGPSVAGLAIPGDIALRPPARCGDFSALLEDPPAAVALVDGYFKLAPTVWHKEIASLLALGTRVIGGASLGAMRAAELERFGMEGVGAIFHAYRSGALVRDDAVMLVHAPAELGYAALSLPLVDAEHVLRLADLPPRARRVMQRIVRRAPFETRTWRACLAEYRRRTGESFPLAAEALEAAPSLKRIDAALVIAALMGAAPIARRPMPPLTAQFRRLLTSTAPAFAAARA